MTRRQKQKYYQFLSEEPVHDKFKLADLLLLLLTIFMVAGMFIIFVGRFFYLW